MISRPKQLTGALEVSTLLLLFALFSRDLIARRHDEWRASRITHPVVNTRLLPARVWFLHFIHGFPSPPLLVPQPTHHPPPPPPCHNSTHRLNQLSPLNNSLKSHGVVIHHKHLGIYCFLHCRMLCHRHSRQGKGKDCTHWPVGRKAQGAAILLNHCAA